jgi:hypothetical protein
VGAAAAGGAATAGGGDGSATASSSRPNLRADVRLAFPATLAPRQRALLHEVAGQVGLAHASTGDEADGSRRLVIGGGEGGDGNGGGDNGDGNGGGDNGDDNGDARPSAATTTTTIVLQPADLNADTDDDDDNITALATLLKTHLGLDDAHDLLSEAKARHERNQQRREAARAAARAAAALPGAPANITAADARVTLEAFVERTAKLLDMERDAEVAQAAEAAAAATPAAAAARGSALLGLRLADAEGGLLGRTLLTLVANKGFAQGAPVSAAPPLPPHKFGPHDLVAIKPNKQGGGGGGASSGDAAAASGGAGAGAGGALATGLVYRIRDNAIVVAVDDAPDEGLDVPLRLEKLANETTHKRMCETLACLRAAAAAGGGQAAAQAAAAAAAAASGGGGRGTQPATELPGAALADVCFGSREPRFSPRRSAARWRPCSAPLDGSQRRAVDLALRAQDVALIHGPPGTGKTTAVVELIVQEVLRGSRVLAAAASNVAVDNLVERVVKAAAGGGGGGAVRFYDEEEEEDEEEDGEDDDNANGKSATAAASRPPPPADPSASLKGLKIVRLGHPARLLPQVLDASLEAHVRRSDDSALARDCARERRRLAQQLVKLEPWKRAERRAARAELRDLGKEERKRQERAVREVVRSARVVCATLTGCLHPHLRGETFDVVVIDEAAQALEPACWGALLKGRRAVLAGDHLQLPPTVLSQEACDKGLGVTLFERLQVMYGGVEGGGGGGGGGASGGGGDGNGGNSSNNGANVASASEMLTVQYRMHRDIMDWSSRELYGGKLTAHPSVAEHTLAGLEGGGDKAAATAGAAPGATTTTPYPLSDAPVLLLVDSAGCGFDESRDEDGANAESLRNEGEAKAALAHAERLIAAGVPAAAIGIITPYAAQVALLRSMRPEHLAQSLEVSTVDGFQGREKEAIIFSAVRSSPSVAGGGGKDGGGLGLGFLRDVRRANVSVTRARRHCALVADTETLRRDPFLARLIDHFEERGEYISAQELVP